MVERLIAFCRWVASILAYRQGHAAGQADQRTQDVEKNDTVAQAVRRAEDHAPPAGDAAAMDDRLRNGPGL